MTVVGAGLPWGGHPPEVSPRPVEGGQCRGNVVALGVGVTYLGDGVLPGERGCGGIRWWWLGMSLVPP